MISTNPLFNRSTDNFVIWAVEEQIKIKAYKAYPHQSIDSFQFSEDSSQLAIVNNHEILFYSTSTVVDSLKNLNSS